MLSKNSQEHSKKAPKPDNSGPQANETGKLDQQTAINAALSFLDKEFNAPQPPPEQRQRAILNAQQLHGNQYVLRKLAEQNTLQRQPGHRRRSHAAETQDQSAQQEQPPEDPSVIITAGSAGEAARLFALYLDGRTPARIIVADGRAASVFDETGGLVAGPIAFVPPVRLPQGVFGSPDAQHYMRALQRIATGEVAFSQGRAQFEGQEVDFGRAFGPQQNEFNQAAPGTIHQFYVVPRAVQNPANQQQQPDAAPDQLPEFLRPQNAQPTANRPPISGNLSPSSGWPGSVVGGASSFAVQMDMSQWVQAGAPNFSFQWDVIKVRADNSSELGRMAGAVQNFQQRATQQGTGQALVESDTEASSGHATWTQYGRRLRMVGEQGNQLLDGTDNENTALHLVREFGVAELTGARAAMAVVGETVHQVTRFLVADQGILRHIISDMQIPWDRSGLYYVRVRATPLTGDTGPRYATTVLAASVYVQDVAQQARSSLDDSGRAQQQLDDLLRQQQQLRDAERLLRQSILTIHGSRRSYYQNVLARVQERLRSLAGEIATARQRLAVAGDTQASLRFDRSQAQQQLDQLLAQHRPTGDAESARYDAEVERLQHQISGDVNLLNRLDTAQGQGGQTTAPMPVSFSSETTGDTQRLLFTIAEQSNADHQVETRLTQINPSATPAVVFHGTGADRAAAFNSALTDMRQNFGHGQGMIAFRPEGAFSTVALTVPNPMPTVMTAGAQLADTASDLSNLLTAVAVLAAPVTGGSSLALLVPAGWLGAAGAAYQLVHDTSRHGWQWNAQTVGELFTIAGAALGPAAKLARLSRIGLIITNNRYVMPLITNGVEAGGYVVMGYSTFQTIASSNGTPEGRQAALESALNTIMAITGGVAGHVAGHSEAAPQDNGRIGGLPDIDQPGQQTRQLPAAGESSVAVGGDEAHPTGNSNEPRQPSRPNTEHPNPADAVVEPGQTTEHPNQTGGPTTEQGHPAQSSGFEAELNQLQNNSHPQLAELRAGDTNALLGLLRRAGSWRDLITALQNGNSPQMLDVARRLFMMRRRVMNDLQRFNARPVDTASAELVSDVDMNVSGPDAGRDLIAAEAHMAETYGPEWSHMFRMNFYTEASRLTLYETALPQLDAAARQQLLARLSDQTTVYDLARMLEHAGRAQTPEGRARGQAEVAQLAQSLGMSEAQVREIERLANMTEAQHTARRNELLLQIDQLVQERNAASDPAQRAQLAQRITELQMEANLHTTEAYVGPGAGIQTVSGRRVGGHEAFQAALSHYEMFQHVVAEHGGDLVAAAREYELFKYVQRFTEAARTAGMSDVRLRFLENLGNYLYRINRTAHAENAAETAANPTEQRAAASERNQRNARNPNSTALDMPFPADPASAPVTDQFLAGVIAQFMGMAHDVLPQLRRNADRPANAAPANDGGNGQAPREPSVIVDPSLMN